MRINIQIFNHLDGVWDKIRGGSTDREWTDKSDVRWTTLSELRRLSRLMATNPNVKVGRSCTIEKIIALTEGLMKLKGESVVRKELLKFITDEKDFDVRFLVKAVIITKHANEEGKRNADTMLDMVLKTLPDE